MKVPLNAVILEDNDDDVFFLLRHLSRAGYDVNHVVVSDLETFESAMAAEGIDVLFCDSNIPGISTEQIIPICEMTRPSVPVVMVSGGVDGISNAAKRFAHACISKDRLGDLDALLRDLLRK